MVSTVPAKSIEGWIIICTNLHEETTEEDVLDFFTDFGHVKNIHLNLDRRTGYAKGYAFIEYADRSEADLAVNEGNGQLILDKRIDVSFAFVETTTSHRVKGAGRQLAASTDSSSSRARSRSPTRDKR